MRRLGIAAACMVPLAAPAQTYLEPPVYVVGIYDGRPTAPGLWFTVDGRSPRHGERLARVDRLSPGVTIDTAPVELRVSTELAAHLGLKRGAPTLFELGRLAPDEATPARTASSGIAAAYGARQARVAALLQELRAAAADTVAADYAPPPLDDATSPSPLAAGPAGAGAPGPGVEASRARP